MFGKIFMFDQFLGVALLCYNDEFKRQKFMPDCIVQAKFANMRKILIIAFICILPLMVMGQTGGTCGVQVVRGDTLYTSFLPEIVVKGKPRSNARYKRYNNSMSRLEYNVRKAYPYALIVARKVDEINAKIATLPNNKDRERWLDDEYKRLFKEFKAPLMKLTYTQGRILVKLIDRETDQTAFEVIREFRGGFVASFWQGIGRLFGHNLKTEYGEAEEDRVLEQIIVYYQAGLL
jgi:hypothetical protein